jgi:hypothetical protein
LFFREENFPVLFIEANVNDLLIIYNFKGGYFLRKAKIK